MTTMPRLWSPLVYLRTLLVFALFWSSLAWWTDNPILLPSPWNLLQAAIELVLELEIFEHPGIRLGRMVISLDIACTLAVPLGLAMGLSRRLERIVNQTVELLRPISGIAWISLALFILGIGNALPVFIIIYAAVFPILLGKVECVRIVDQRLIDAARTTGITPRTIVLRMFAPSALPSLLVALRFGAGRGQIRGLSALGEAGLRKDRQQAGCSGVPGQGCGITVWPAELDERAVGRAQLNSGFTDRKER